MVSVTREEADKKHFEWRLKQEAKDLKVHIRNMIVKGWIKIYE
tara:strand:- start:476 stop:604 length:129 start_codon:yes stop_codon:yes gene_type:complete